ncbi:hypothetical protein [Sorangium sp. So ce131]|uniref:hypothetical protein n=1 Tax=Sorangium sp. So ce131 TaxID=3133282 RepID=UPI003F5DB28C
MSAWAPLDTSDAVLILCPVEWRNRPPRALGEALVALRPSRGGGFALGFNTAILRIDEAPVHYEVIPAGAGAGAATSGDLPCRSALSSVRIGRTLAERLGKTADLAPLFLIVRRDGRLFTYSAVSFDDDKVLFLNSNPEGPPVLLDGRESVLDLTRRALENHHAHRLVLNNHNNHNPFLKKFAAGEEIEYKLNIDPGADIWRIAADFFDTVRSGGLEGHVIHWMTQFMTWEFDNLIYESLEPASQRGYIAFIPCPDDKYIVKQKIYAEDSLRRIELSKKNVVLPGTFEDYLAANYPQISYKKHPPFNRVRYDVDFESLETGNHFSVMFDRCRIDDPTCPPLSQCEIEYMGTRTIGQPRMVMEELGRIYQFVKQELGRAGIPFEETFYSKLSYLKDCERLLAEKPRAV